MRANLTNVAKGPSFLLIFLLVFKIFVRFIYLFLESKGELAGEELRETERILVGFPAEGEPDVSWAGSQDPENMASAKMENLFLII